MAEEAFAFNPAVRAGKFKRISDGQPWQKDELFPTPPWATRALVEIVLPRLHVRNLGTVWEPCAGLGHMSDTLRGYSADVIATDKNIYPLADGRTTHAFDVAPLDFLKGDRPRSVDWIITNPPFMQSQAMVERALQLARGGVAVALRMQWLETLSRWELFRRCPPSLFAAFVERVAMSEGGWDPKDKKATGYAWFIWAKDRDGWAPPARAYEGAFDGMLIPPCKKTLTRDSDAKLAARFVPGFVPPSTIKKAGKAQKAMELTHV